MESNFKEEVAGAATKYCIAKPGITSAKKMLFSRLSIKRW